MIIQSGLIISLEEMTLTRMYVFLGLILVSLVHFHVASSSKLSDQYIEIDFDQLQKGYKKNDIFNHSTQNLTSNSAFQSTSFNRHNEKSQTLHTILQRSPHVRRLRASTVHQVGSVHGLLRRRVPVRKVARVSATCGWFGGFQPQLGPVSRWLWSGWRIDRVLARAGKALSSHTQWQL